MKLLLGLSVVLCFTAPLAAETFLVENGRPRSVIVVAESPPRTVRLAAQELQNYVEKITGAHLPIVTEPGEAATVPIYVGASRHTDRLGITAAGLQDGAFRIVSGDGWLVLIGQDTEFTPIEPWARSNAEIASGKLQREWDQITGALWGVPQATLYKNRFRLPGDTGLLDERRQAGQKFEPLELWGFDERGTFNAVCGWLRKLGVRWYAPGELGEVLPDLKTIPLPKLDETVRPDFPIRRVNVRFGVHGLELARWAMRLGLRDPYGVQVAHGMDTMTQRAEILARHPDWFALYGGKRHNQPGQRLNQLCYSNEELFQETVRYVRAQLDHYRLDAISVMPPDGYTAICQCPRCAGQDSPDRDQRGLLSDYVWNFVNRVAKEVRKTHPDKKILNCAYGVYTLPPLKIDRLEPNVVVSIVGGRRPMNNKPEQQEEIRKLRESWLAKTDNPIIIFENYPFTDRGWYLPSFTPHAMGASINATKGVSQGEDIWLSVRQDFEKVGIGLNHFLIYFTQRMYWGGQEQDVDALFREYCRLFYGPAEQEMLAFFQYCEANWQEMEKDKVRADRALKLFAQAQARADADSVYGRRLAWMDDYLKALRSKSRQLGQKRGPVPVLRLVGEARGPIAVDGQLDDEAWVNAFPSATCRFRELQTGCQPIFGTTVKSTWIGSNLYFAIRCEEHPGEKPNVGTTKDDDSALWYGDCVEVLLETDSRSYYQIAVGPSGAVVDLDRSAARQAWFSWDSQAEVATHVADDYWTVEMRIPVTQDENDPLHQVIGRKPTQSLPWHINLCRQRIRAEGQEHSAFSPTGGDNFHDAMKFAHFYDGRSHQFEAAEPQDVFFHAIRSAADLARTGRRDEALAAYTAAAEGKVSQLQRSYALEQAAATARSLRKLELADQLAARIPLAAVRNTVLMRNLLDRSQAARLVEQFAQEDIAAWPFWKRGDGYFARGQAYAATRAGRQAESDLASALPWTSDERTRDAIHLALGQNRENNLQDDAAALEAYQAIIATARQLGSSNQFNAVQAIARIQAKRGQFDEALATLGKVETDQLRGFWHDTILLARGDTLRAAGRPDEARKVYQSILADDEGDPRLRRVAEERVHALEAR
ncbi:MAG: tetratricopeptide repeat protein [Candidatus Anammoximicrobium sp.]|nr:tetratricopeptide repeat protein [Candidatus Anammoximicrobium sp.]